MTRQRWLYLGCVLLVLGGLAGMYYMMHHERWRFSRAVSVGMSAEEVQRSVGPPTRVLREGEVLPVFGGSTPRTVAHETWVYFVFPGSQHRFAVTMIAGKVAKVEYNAN